MAESRGFLRNAFIVSVATFLSRVLGLVRDVLSAYIFGTSAAMDAFVLAFTIPNLFRGIFGEGAVSAGFIPVFSDLEKNRGPDAANRLFAAGFTWLTLVLVAVTALGLAVCVTAGWFARSADSQRLVGLLLILLPYTIFICLTALLGAAQQARNSFAPYALASAIMNVLWIAGLVFLAPSLGVFGVALAILASGVLQLAVQLIAARRVGLRARFLASREIEGLRRVLYLMLPVVLGLAVVRINTAVDALIAKVCVPGDGANAALFYGNRLMQFPLAIVGLALAQAIFPVLARHAAGGDHRRFLDDLGGAMRTIFCLAAPAVALGIVLRRPLIELFFRHGDFGAESTARTAAVLMWYMSGLWAYCAYHILARAFYALHDTRTPVMIGLKVLALNLALNLTLVWPLREAGLALSTAICSAVSVVLLLRTLQARLGGRETRLIASSTRGLLLYAAPGAACAAAAYGALLLVGGGAGLALRVVRVAAPSLGGIAAFVLVALVMRLPELGELVRALRPRFRRGRPAAAAAEEIEEDSAP